MKKKLFVLGGAFVLAAGAVFVSLQNVNTTANDLLLANVEALAGGEVNDGTGCKSIDSTCYKVVVYSDGTSEVAEIPNKLN